jgi:hypothetical protein
MHGLTDAHFAILGMSTNITSLGFFNYWDFSEPLAAPFAALAAGGMQLKELAIELTIIEEERRGDEYDDGEDEYDAPERYRLTDACLSAISNFVNLEEFYLVNAADMTDGGLCCLALCTNLRSIKVIDCRKVSGCFLNTITKSCPLLRKVGMDFVNYNQQTEEFPPELSVFSANCPLLEEIDLPFGNDDDVRSLVRGCTLLRRMRFTSYDLSSASIKAIAGGLPAIEELILPGSVWTDEGLRCLATGACAKHLRAVVPYCGVWAHHKNMAKGVTEAGIWALVDSCPRMETLRCSGIMDKGLLSVLCSRGIRHHHLEGRKEYFDLSQRQGMLLRSKSASARGRLTGH